MRSEMAHLPSDVTDMFQYSGKSARGMLGGGLVDYSTQLMLGGGLVRKEAVK